MSHQDRVFFGNFVAVLVFLVVAAFVFFFIAKAVVKMDDDAGENTALTQKTQENIKPIGTVVVAGESSAGAGAATGPRSGSDVYNSFCMACHDTGAAGAPKVGDKAAWAPRANKGLDGLLATAKSGINAMPPMGTCADCSDEELQGAIRYILTETGIKVAGGDAASAAAPAPAPAAASAAVDGKQIYDSACMACHTTGAAGAPKLGDTAAWSDRIAKGMDTLVQHAINGFNAMPPRGACATCSDDDIQAAVKYMVDESK